jgi:hypothetical protein
VRVTPRESLRESVKRYLEAGSTLSKAGRNEVEGLLHDLFDDATSGRERVEDIVEEFAARSRRSAEQLAEMVRAEIRREIAARAARRRDEMIRNLATKGRADLADLVDRVSAIVGDLVNTGRSAASTGVSRAGERWSGHAGPGSAQVDDELDSSAREHTGRPSTTGATGQPPAAEGAATKAAAAKKAAKKAPAKTAAASRGPATVASERAPAKKPAAKSAAAKKAGAAAKAAGPAAKAPPVKKAAAAKRTAVPRPRSGESGPASA